MKSFVDFGKSVVDAHSHDAFILDTNVVLAYIIEHNPKHLAVFHFLHYLIAHHCSLYVTETVVHEVIHVLARNFYAQDMISEQHPLLSPAKRKEIRLQYERQFTTVTKPKPYYNATQSQKCKETLRKYTTKALDLFLPFLNNFCGYLPSSPEQLNYALELCAETPLHSSDAMIAASTLNIEHGTLMGLISLDRDMTSLTGITVYFTEVNNETYDQVTMRHLFGIEEMFYDQNPPLIDV